MQRRQHTHLEPPRLQVLVPIAVGQAWVGCPASRVVVAGGSGAPGVAKPVADGQCDVDQLSNLGSTCQLACRSGGSLGDEGPGREHAGGGQSTSGAHMGIGYRLIGLQAPCWKRMLRLGAMAAAGAQAGATMWMALLYLHGQQHVPSFASYGAHNTINAHTCSQTPLQAASIPPPYRARQARSSPLHRTLR